MKIVFISSRPLDDIGGIEAYMKNLTPRLVEKGHEVILYINGGWFQKSNYKGVTIIAVPSIKHKFITKILTGIVATIHSLLFNRKVDLYHYNANAAALTSFLPLIFKFIVVYQGHGFEWKRAKWSPFMRRMIQYLDDFVIHVNKNITMVSQEQSDYIKSRYNKDSYTIPSGVDINNKIYELNFLDECGLKSNEYILFLGRLVPEKKADVLIDAFIKLNNRDLKLVIAGSDENEKKYIQGLKDKSKVCENIIFLGSVFDDDKEALIQNCKMFCIPSELEGLPITLLEAMSYGKICVASNIEANKEALADCGVYFDVNNSDDLVTMLSYTISQFDTIQSLGTMAKQRVEDHFTWDSIANQFDVYYKSLVHSK